MNRHWIYTMNLRAIAKQAIAEIKEDHNRSKTSK